jgi:hypothetical protein
VLDIVLRPTADLSASEKTGLMRVMSEAFTLSVPAEQIAELYCSTVAGVLFAYDRRELAGFQFFQECTVDGVAVSHFSLAGKSEAYHGAGLQRAFGTYLMRRALGRLVNPFRRIAIAGVSNNPKSYRNMLLIGGAVFPDVTRAAQAFPYGELYARVARRLGIQGLELSTGVVRNRCASLGFRMKPSAFEQRADSINQGFMRYVEGDVNHGIFTLAVSTPLAAVTSFAGRQLGLHR